MKSMEGRGVLMSCRSISWNWVPNRVSWARSSPIAEVEVEIKQSNFPTVHADEVVDENADISFTSFNTFPACLPPTTTGASPTFFCSTSPRPSAACPIAWDTCSRRERLRSAGAVVAKLVEERTDSALFKTESVPNAVVVVVVVVVVMVVRDSGRILRAATPREAIVEIG